MKRLALTACLFLLPALLRAEWRADPADALQVEAAAALTRFREADPAIGDKLAQAYAIAVFPRVLRAGLGFGGAGGRGVLLQGDQLLGEVRQAVVTLGVQAGAQSHSQLIVFRNQEALDLFVGGQQLPWPRGRLEFAGRAAVAAGRAGAATEPGFSADVAIFSLGRGGLMLELAAGIARYRFTADGGVPPQ